MQFIQRFHIFLIVVAVGTMAFGQSERGTIGGTVTDSSGAVVPNAKVTVTNESTNTRINLTTNETGSFTAPSLAVGLYTVRVEREGFRPYVKTGVAVNAATTVRADV